AAVVALDVGQRLHQDASLLGRVQRHVVYSELIRTYSGDRSFVSTVTDASPRPRSAITSTSRSRSAARALSRSPGPSPPPAQSFWPPSHTSTCAGSNGIEVVPRAASTRPQFGSAPCSAHRNSTESAIRTAACFASRRFVA